MINVISIENQHFTAKIDLKGAQLASLIKKSTNYEYIWQRDPKYWTDSAPNLFPIVGHLKDNSYQYQQQSYQMPKHGVVRHEPFLVRKDGGDHCQLAFQDTPKSRAAYPFSFTLLIDFTLTDNGLKVDYTIQNQDENIMPVGLGYHPAFAIDTENHAHEDYQIIFNKAEDLNLYGLVDNYFGLRQKDYLKGNTIPLTSSLFDQDALVFTNINSDAITIKRKTDDWFLTMETGGAPHLGLWAKSAAPYVCIEPWYTYLDGPDATGDLLDKPGMYALEAGVNLKRGYRILV